MNLQSFQTFGFPNNASCRSINCFRSPSICLHISFIADSTCYSFLFVCIGGRARSSCSFRNHCNLKRFHPLFITGCSCCYTIFCPAKPAISLYMGAIINIIVFSLCSGQLNLDRLNRLACPCRTGYLSTCNIALPSLVFHKGSITYTQISVAASNGNLERFHSFILSGHSDLIAVLFRCHPAIILHMGAA